MTVFQRHLKSASLTNSGSLLTATGRFSLLKGENASLRSRMARLHIVWVVMILLAGLATIPSGHTQTHRTIVDPVGRAPGCADPAHADRIAGAQCHGDRLRP
jgi:hypothetical protein